jgi:hypothetical protein
VSSYLGEVVPAMFTTLAFFLIAVTLMLGVVADSLWGRFQRPLRHPYNVGCDAPRRPGSSSK